MNVLTPSHRSGTPAAWMLVLPLLFVCVTLFTRTDGHAWGDDWAQYVNHGRNLAEGREFADTGYLFNPDRPNIGPPSYPPGTAMLLAPVIAVAGVDVPLLKLVPIACLALALVIFLRLGSKLVSPSLAFGAAVLFIFHPEVWKYSRVIGSEPPFILFTLWALLMARTWRDPSKPAGELASAVLTGLFAYAAISCRSIGMALLPAIFLFEALAGRLARFWVWVALATATAGILLQRSFLGDADYSTEIAQRSVAKVVENLIGYWGAVGFLFPLPGPLVWLTPIVVLGLAGIGLAAFMRSEAGQRSGLLAWLRAVPLEVWYVAASMGALILLPFLALSRYVLPLLPIILLFVLQGLVVVAERLVPSARPRHLVLAAVAAGFALFYGALWWKSREPQTDALCTDCRALYEAVARETPLDARVAFIKPRLLALMTRRTGWAWAPGRTEQQTWDEFTAKGIGYLVTVSPRQELAELYPAFLDWDGWRSRPGTTVIYENPSFRLIRLADAETSTQ